MTELPRHVLEQRLSCRTTGDGGPVSGSVPSRSLERPSECLFVPGRTAQKRISRWLAEMEAEADAFADEKGRDAFVFNPFESRYLKFSSQHLHRSKSVFSRLRSLNEE